MIRLYHVSWEKGRSDGQHGLPSKCPKGLDPFVYASGYVEGKAERAKRPRPRVVSSSKATMRSK